MEREKLIEELKQKVDEISSLYARICDLQDVHAENQMLSISVDADGYYAVWNTYWELPRDLGINFHHLAHGESDS